MDGLKIHLSEGIKTPSDPLVLFSTPLRNYSVDQRLSRGEKLLSRCAEELIDRGAELLPLHAFILHVLLFSVYHVDCRRTT